MNDNAAAARQLKAGGADLDEIFTTLRESGASQTECLKVAMEVEGIRLAEAKVIVDASPAFADLRASNERLRDEAIAAFEDPKA